jgi:hypothetical protein
MDQERAPGSEGVVPTRWPEAAGPARSASGPTVLFFAHPHCPCTLAGLQELRECVARAAAPVDVRVAFVRPGDAGPEWRSGPAWETARSIPGARLQEDPEGALARLFGARTSGLVAVYGPEGGLLLRGGLTRGRGVAGRSAGGEALAAVLGGRRPAFAAVPVFGCPLRNESSSGSAP